MKKFLIATMGADFRRCAEKFDTGIEIDFFCMAENLDGRKYEGVSRELGKLIDSSGISGEDMVLYQ